MTDTTILVIDDNKSDLLYFRSALEREGYHVRVATDGVSGIRSVRSKCPDLVLLDYDLPDLNGVEVCRFLRSLPEFKNLPIVLASVFDSPEVRSHAFSAGVNDFIIKPVEPPELHQRLDNLFELMRIKIDRSNQPV